MASLMYGISVLSCMSSALSEPGGAGLGTLGLSAAKAEELAATPASRGSARSTSTTPSTPSTRSAREVAARGGPGRRRARIRMHLRRVVTSPSSARPVAR